MTSLNSLTDQEPCQTEADEEEAAAAAGETRHDSGAEKLIDSCAGKLLDSCAGKLLDSCAEKLIDSCAEKLIDSLKVYLHNPTDCVVRATKNRIDPGCENCAARHFQ
jgi:hypothetical protein